MNTIMKTTATIAFLVLPFAAGLCAGNPEPTTPPETANLKIHETILGKEEPSGCEINNAAAEYRWTQPKALPSAKGKVSKSNADGLTEMSVRIKKQLSAVPDTESGKRHPLFANLERIADTFEKTAKTGDRALFFADIPLYLDVFRAKAKHGAGKELRSIPNECNCPHYELAKEITFEIKENPDSIQKQLLASFAKIQANVALSLGGPCWEFVPPDTIDAAGLFIVNPKAIAEELKTWPFEELHRFLRGRTNNTFFFRYDQRDYPLVNGMGILKAKYAANKEEILEEFREVVDIYRKRATENAIDECNRRLDNAPDGSSGKKHPNYELARRIVRRIARWHDTRKPEELFDTFPLIEQFSTSKDVDSKGRLIRRMLNTYIDMSMRGLIRSIGYDATLQVSEYAKSNLDNPDPKRIRQFTSASVSALLQDLDGKPIPGLIDSPGVFILDAETSVAELKTKSLEQIREFLDDAPPASFFSRYEPGGDGMDVLKAKYAAHKAEIREKFAEVIAYAAQLEEQQRQSP